MVWFYAPDFEVEQIGKVPCQDPGEGRGGGTRSCGWWHRCCSHRTEPSWPPGWWHRVTQGLVPVPAIPLSQG